MPAAGADLLAVGRAVAAASAAAAALAAALAQTAAAFDSSQLAEPTTVAESPRVGRTRQSAAARRALRRRAPRLPIGLLDDTPEGLEHLARLAGAVVLVDGYNVSKTGWSELDLPTQRLRLIRALVDLAARTSARIEVVFDGAEVFQGWVRTVPASIGVRFSPADVEADDVLIARIDELPPGPVVVVSSDHRVRDGARARGAVAVASSALVALAKNTHGLGFGLGANGS